MARLTSFLNAVVLLTDLTGQGHDRGASSIHSVSPFALSAVPKNFGGCALGSATAKEVRGGAGFGGREAESHPKRSFPVRKEFVPPGFLQWE